MIRVIVSNSMTRQAIVVSPDTSIRSCFDQTGVGFAGGAISVDGRMLGDNELDNPIGDFATGDNAYLMSVVKVANA